MRLLPCRLRVWWQSRQLVSSTEVRRATGWPFGSLTLKNWCTLVKAMRCSLGSAALPILTAGVALQPGNSATVGSNRRDRHGRSDHVAAIADRRALQGIQADRAGVILLVAGIGVVGGGPGQVDRQATGAAGYLGPHRVGGQVVRHIVIGRIEYLVLHFGNWPGAVLLTEMICAANALRASSVRIVWLCWMLPAAPPVE